LGRTTWPLIAASVQHAEANFEAGSNNKAAKNADDDLIKAVENDHPPVIDPK
jgi:hypothetical protein